MWTRKIRPDLSKPIIRLKLKPQYARPKLKIQPIQLMTKFEMPAPERRLRQPRSNGRSTFFAFRLMRDHPGSARRKALFTVPVALERAGGFSRATAASGAVLRSQFRCAARSVGAA